jgi:hypothetical protein
VGQVYDKSEPAPMNQASVCRMSRTIWSDTPKSSVISEGFVDADLLTFVNTNPRLEMLHDSFCRSEGHAKKLIDLAVSLQLNDNQLVLLFRANKSTRLNLSAVSSRLLSDSRIWRGG